MLSPVLNVLLISCILIQLAQSLTVDEELTLTFNQKNLLDKFREIIKPRLTKEYMNRDIYLVRWLRESQFNLEEAERKIINNLEWRRENNVDNIEQQDWTDILENYPYTTDVKDKEERPTFAFSFGEWDIRRGAVSGKSRQLVLYWAKVMEELMAKVRKLQSEGRNVTQVDFIIDILNYNIQQHACVQCVPVYVGLITLIRDHYPGDVHMVHLVNAPRIFEFMMSALRPYMGKTEGGYKIYGTNRKEWRAKLLEEFDQDQLPLQFGGTKFINEID